MSDGLSFKITLRCRSSNFDKATFFSTLFLVIFMLTDVFTGDHLMHGILILISS